jgi:hypothetical protein
MGERAVEERRVFLREQVELAFDGVREPSPSENHGTSSR